MESQEYVVEVKNVSKVFSLPHERQKSIKKIFTGLFESKNEKPIDRQYALEDITFNVNKGEFFGIVGRNGSGKSTLLKIIAQIYQPTEGQISVCGKLVPFIELGVGFNPELTGKENVYLNGAMLGFTQKEIDKMYDDIVSFSELERFMDQRLKNYSSGMQVRLAFSMAIRANADILLIDEVLAVGDAAFQQKCLEYFRKLKKDQKTVIFVSHDMEAVRQFCDRAVLIEKSRIVSEGSADRIAEEYSRLFIKEAQVQNTDQEVAVDRWGSGDAVFESVRTNTSVVTDKIKFIELSGVIRFIKAVENPVIGFKIADGTGKLLVGTNSAILKIDMRSYQAGEEAEFIWRIPNIFSNGSYEVSLAIIEQDGRSLDVWNSAVPFKIMKPTKTPYITAPDIELTIRGEA